MLKHIFMALVFLFVISPAFAISEKDFFTDYQKKVVPFYNSCELGFFYGSENKRINYLKYESEQKDTAVVILPGKSESYLKYAELIYDLKNPGFSFYLMDHRGMGFSERPVQNMDKVFVEKFDYYVSDFKKFMDRIVIPKKHKNLFLISHSMGGTIAALYLESCSSAFKGAVFCSPMMKINTGICPEKAAGLMTKLFIALGMEKRYCITQGKRKHRSFKNNKLSSSKKRWDLWEEKILSGNPEIISGGATNRWVNESIKACKKALKNSCKIEIPALILKAEKDSIVKPESMDILCERTDCEKVLFKDAKHEILMETDSIRDVALECIKKFIKIYSSEREEIF